MNHSTEIDKISAALVAAQAEMPTPALDRAVNSGKYGYRYATLAEIVKLTKPTLAAHGLAVVQSAGDDGVTTRIVHESGQWIESTPLRVMIATETPQAQGSALTYARRYSLNAMLSLAPADEDDDAQAAMPPRQQSATPSAPPQTGQQRPAAPAQATRLVWPFASKDPTKPNYKGVPLSQLPYEMLLWAKNKGVFDSNHPQYGAENAAMNAEIERCLATPKNIGNTPAKVGEYLNRVLDADMPPVKKIRATPPLAAGNIDDEPADLYAQDAPF